MTVTQRSDSIAVVHGNSIGMATAAWTVRIEVTYLARKAM